MSEGTKMAVDNTFEGLKPQPRTMAEFFRLIDDSLGAHASRKGYSDAGADGTNKLYEFTQSIGASAGHSCGEIIYKMTEYMKEPREVLLIKAAAWAFLEWKYGSYSK